MVDALALIESWNGLPKEGVALDVSTLAALNSDVHYRIAQCMAAAGHTCLGSSDGTTGAMDGVNRISAAAKWVHGTGGSPRSWMAWKSKAGMAAGGKFVYWLWAASSTQIYQVNFWELSAAPTSGTATADPTLPSSTLYHAFADQQVTASTSPPATTHTIRYGYSASGKFWISVSKDASGIASFVKSWFGGTRGSAAADDLIGVGSIGYAASSLGPFTKSALQQNTSCTTFWTDGTAIAAGGIGYLSGPVGDSLAIYTNTGNSINGDYPATSLSLESCDTGKKAIRGQVDDLLGAPVTATIAQGVQLPNGAGSPLFVSLGEFWVAGSWLDGNIQH